VSSKKTKEEVDYSKGMLHSHCGPVFHDDRYYCQAFIARATHTGGCKKVAGAISPDHWCTEYHRVQLGKASS